MITLRDVTLDPETRRFEGRRGWTELSEDAALLAERLMRRPAASFNETAIIHTIGAEEWSCSVMRLRRCLTEVSTAFASLSMRGVRLRLPPATTFGLTVRL